MSNGSSPLPGETRVALVRRAFQLEWITVLWMTVEAIVAIGAGIVAHSLLLTAFGLDSLIELASAAVLIWRLWVELRQARNFSGNAEHYASRICGGLLFLLAAYILVVVGWSVWRQQGAEFSIPGLVLAVAAIPIMYFLSKRKLLLAEQLESRALRADAIESMTCGWLSLVVILGLLSQVILKAWWVDPLASLTVVYFLLKEGAEAWQGDQCC